METNIANLVSWCVDGPTTLHGYDDDLVYILVEADTEDPELQRQVALVSAWDTEGERYAQMIAAVPKLLAACQAVETLLREKQKDPGAYYMKIMRYNLLYCKKWDRGNAGAGGAEQPKATGGPT